MHPALNLVGFITECLGHEMTNDSCKMRWATALVPIWYQYLYGSMAEHGMGKIRVQFLVLPKGSEPLYPWTVPTYLIYSLFLKLFHFAWNNKLLIG